MESSPLSSQSYLRIASLYYYQISWQETVWLKYPELQSFLQVALTSWCWQLCQFYRRQDYPSEWSAILGISEKLDIDTRDAS